MLKYIRAKIRLSELHSQNVTVPAWELPLLQAIHGTGVREIGDVHVDRPAPAAADEFARLAGKYRHPENTPDNPYVAQVYGAFGPGVARLQQEIDKAGDKAVVKPKADKTTEPVDPLVA